RRPQGIACAQYLGHVLYQTREEVVTERKQADEAFRLIVVGTAATTGNDFFPSLVKHMAQVLRARYALWPPPERADQSRSSTRSRVNLALIGAARAAARIQSVESSRDHSR